ncbi:P-type DNA transfer ATPase VirB11 [Pseudomonas chlororaphis]|uniref:P-type DNA transfer ATPase VirB11 n=1 Tax=Pseudomonas chlororaphis TaxID=587753 RepID=UPI002D79E30C|nr:P-type DNA transfer ATPase VirB11 [Pseudomonas chlororaphis]
MGEFLNQQSVAGDVVDTLVDSTLLQDFLQQAGITERLNRPGVTEVEINRPFEIWTATDEAPSGSREEAPWLSYDLCYQVVNSLAAFNGVELSPESPIHTLKFPDVFPDGVRAQIVVPPACEKGTISMTIRRPSMDRFSLWDYINSERFKNAKAISRAETKLLEWQLQIQAAHTAGDWGEFFRLAVNHRQNIIIFGGPGSGKTTFAKALTDLFPIERRMITIEAINELLLPLHANHVHLLYGPTVSPKALVASTMRMKPDHLFLAELTGDEAWHYMEILNTGVPGTVTTAHANDCAAGFARVCGLVKQSEVGKGLDYSYIERLVKTSFDIVVYMEKTQILEVHYEPEQKLMLLNGQAA